MVSPFARRLFAALALLPAAAPAGAETVRVAVASNFVGTAAELGESFEGDTGHEVELIPGSSGKLYAQIVNGAPFDLFLSADAERPARLEAEGLAVAGSRRTYAEGRLVAWSSAPAPDGSACLAALRPGVAGKVAIANPALAPYGAAARAYLEHAGLWAGVEPRLVYGENIAQTLQFAAGGGAVVAFVAAAQLTGDNAPKGVCAEPLPAASHPPIAQQLVLLERAADNVAASAFLDYLASDAARARIEASGYAVSAP